MEKQFDIKIWIVPVIVVFINLLTFKGFSHWSYSGTGSLYS
jgi:hypothetical protein